MGIPREDDGQPFGSTLGLRLKIARENAGLTPKDLAKLLGVEPESIRAWEGDERAPRANRLVMLTGLLDVSLSWLFEGRESEYMETQGASTVKSLRSELEHARQSLADALDALDSATARLEIIEIRLRRGERDALIATG